MKNDKYKQNQEQKRNERLLRKYENKFYYTRYSLEYKASIFFSWIFSIGSGLCAFAFMFFVFKLVIASWFISAALAAVICTGWELLKRHSLILANEDYYRQEKPNLTLFLFCIVISGGSIAASYFGAKWTIADSMNEPELIAGTEQKKLLAVELAKIEERINKYENDSNYKTSSGKTYHNLVQFTIPVLERKRDTLSSRLIALQSQIDKTNKETQVSHLIYRSEMSWHYALAVGIFDILLILCVGYKEYYENREAIEKGLKDGQSRNAPNYEKIRTTPVSKPSSNGIITANYKASNNVSREILPMSDILEIKKEIRRKQGALRSNKSQLRRGKGDPETKKAKIQLYQREIQELKTKLSN